MQTQLADFVKQQPEHQELQSILRSCVHCGFCTAACPTYQLTGDELDGPRGRIYLMKQMLEGAPVSKLTQVHLDRCLTCRACETVCPSGVRYGRLLDISRGLLEQKVARKPAEQIKLRLIQAIFPYPRRFAALLRFAQLLQPFLPRNLTAKLPRRQPRLQWPIAQHARKMLIMPGCVQSILAPQIDIKTAQVLDCLGISLLRINTAACCGALNYHLGEHRLAREFAKKNIDACWPYIEQGAEAIVMTASGCGVMVKDYAELLKYDADYLAKAQTMSTLTKDVSEILQAEELRALRVKKALHVAFQAPCTLQHGQQLSGVVESILENLGHTLQPIENAHLCCGSAGVYSLLQADFARQLQKNKLQSLTYGEVDVIASANIGCINHLQAASQQKVLHWIELL